LTDNRIGDRSRRKVVAVGIKVVDEEEALKDVWGGVDIGRRKIAIVGIKAVDEEEASEGGMVGDCSDKGRRKVADVGIRVEGEEKDEASIVEDQKVVMRKI